MKKLGIVLVVLAAIALIYAPVMAADQTTAPAATDPVKKAATPADVKAGKTATPAEPAAATTDPAKTGKKSKIKKEPVTVTGMVVEVKDKKGKVTVVIQADKDTIQVVKQGKGTDLVKLVGKKVEAKGTVAEKKGKKYLYVKEYKEVI